MTRPDSLESRNALFTKAMLLADSLEQKKGVRHVHYTEDAPRYRYNPTFNAWELVTK